MNVIRFVACLVFLLATQAHAAPLSIHLGKAKISIEVKDPELFKNITQTLLPKEKQNNEITLALLGSPEENVAYLKELESADVQTQRECLVTHLKDLIDSIAEKAPVAADAKFSDLPIPVQKELTALAILREQVGLSWLEVEIEKRKLKKPTANELAKILGTEISLLISDETVEAYFKKK